MDRFLYSSRSGLRRWDLYAGPDGRCPVALEWGHGVGVVADPHYVPIRLYTSEPGEWCRNHLSHVREIAASLDGGALVADQNGTVDVWVRGDQVVLATTALRALFAGYRDVVSLAEMLGTKACRVTGISRDPRRPLVLELEPVDQQVPIPDVGVQAGDEIELPPKGAHTEPRPRQAWWVDNVEWILPRHAAVAVPSSGPSKEV